MFKRFFLNFKAQQIRFNTGCRRFIRLDGAHLKTIEGGALLSAVILDTNQGIFPLAVAIFEGENKDSWTWFLEQFRNYMDISNGMELSIMSYRQKSLITTTATVFPGAELRYCARYMCMETLGKNTHLSCFDKNLESS